MAAKQPVILTVNYTSILLPDDTNLAAILRTLSRGLIVQDHLYKDEIVISKRSSVRVEVATVPAGTVFLHETEDGVAPIAAGPRGLLIDRRRLAGT